MTFSIIIATKNRSGFLARALDSLAAQVDAPSFETIVVDNGSIDDTQAMLAARADRDALGLTVIAEPIANRGKARNRGIAVATGDLVLFIDDDVVLPPGFVAAHARAQDRVFPFVVSGPIVNVPSYDERPEPAAANFSNAFFCTCNVSVPRNSLNAVGGFDEQFDLYGWEDTELGLRLRAFDVRRDFAWDAFLWHIKPPQTETLENALSKTIEKARMAARFVKKAPTFRAKLATGAYALNLGRAKALTPRAAQPFLAGLATSPKVPAPLANVARGLLLDSVYADELSRALERP